MSDSKSFLPFFHSFSMPQKNKEELYAPIFRKFLRAKLDVDYSLDDIRQRKAPPPEVLQCITPKMIVEYLRMAAYGTETPQESDCPTLLRSNTLLYWKKAISHYMMMSNSAWDEFSNRGNPTKSKDVNECIKSVMKSEVRKQGVNSAARRALEYKEFLNLLTIIRKNAFDEDQTVQGQLKWIRLLSLLTLQWQLIGRMDDMMHLNFSCLTTNIQFPFSLYSRLRWSKNIREERDVPEQIVVSSNDYKMDPLLNLAIYLEAYGREQSISSSDSLYGGESNSYTMRRLFDSVLSNDDFKKLVKGNLGTHSVRKGASTYGTRSGLSREYVIRRGRWRSKKQVVDIYIDLNQPYPDTLAACKLCGPKGACKYKINHDSVTDEFIITKLVPHSCEALGEQAALALGKAVLWAAFEDKNNPNDECSVLPEWLRREALNSFREEYGRDETPIFNPVSKVTIVPQGAGDQVHLLEIGIDSDGNAVRDSGEQQSRSISNTIDDMQAVLSHMLQVQRQIEESRVEVLSQMYEHRHYHSKQLDIMNRNIKRIALQPVLRSRALIEQASRSLQGETDEIEDGAEGRTSRLAPRPLAQLFRSPKSLYDLWQEYQFGLNGEKPAKDFNSRERGKNKSMYCRRKVFWDVIRNLINAGFTSDAAIDKVYQVYGRGTSVTSILVMMVSDRKTGGNPNLQV